MRPRPAPTLLCFVTRISTPTFSLTLQLLLANDNKAIAFPPLATRTPPPDLRVHLRHPNSLHKPNRAQETPDSNQRYREQIH